MLPDHPIAAEVHLQPASEQPAPPADPPLPSPGRLTWLGLLVESACVAIAFILAWFGIYDHRQPLSDFFRLSFSETVIWSGVGFVAISALAGLTVIVPGKTFRELREFVQKTLIPLFSPTTLWQVGVISLAAGIGEEFLFRWCIQGGLMHFIPGPLGPWLAIFVAAALFGLCHAVTWLYTVVTAVIGVVLGMLVLHSGSVIPAMAAHAAYDFAAIVILRWLGRRNASPR